MTNEQLTAEWLEADGLGGYASGTVGGWRTRRYHALLLISKLPPTQRMVLVNGLDAWVETAAGRVDLSTQMYAPNVRAPEGWKSITAFQREPWPTWTYQLPDGSTLTQELFVPREHEIAVLKWTRTPGNGPMTLHVRPFLSGRDHHALHQENHDFDFTADVSGDRVGWQPYDELPGVVAATNGTYQHEPLWYRQFLYSEEAARGLDSLEDLAAPGVISFDLVKGPAVLLLMSDAAGSRFAGSALELEAKFRAQETRRRQSLPSPLHRAAQQYLVRRGNGLSIIAGYPWFTDWGRDTFISLRGLCLATGWLQEARDILLAWALSVSEGMVPNRFPDEGEQPEFNSVDASLWFIIVVYDYLAAAQRAQLPDDPGVTKTLLGAVAAILAGYQRGTRHRIKMDDDGLLAAGEPGVQLTWMDAKVGEWVVTPRTGKPVEVQALWLNALALSGKTNPEHQRLHEHGLTSFHSKFWDAANGRLFDVVDVNHQAGRTDSSLRPNQLLAVAGLPLQLLPPEQARAIVDQCEAELTTPLGLRTLGPKEPGYQPRYEGGPRERDGAYHQGTVWPWLMGPFVEAWVRVRGNTAAAKQAARAKFLPALEQHLNVAGLGHLSEIADGGLPQLPRGCPFQAWSLGEYLRLKRLILE